MSQQPRQRPFKLYWRIISRSPWRWLWIPAVLWVYLHFKTPDYIPPSFDYRTDETIVCDDADVIDGDTMDCDGVRIRLAGIDAPEMPGHCSEGRECTAGSPFAAYDALVDLAAGEVVCHPIAKDVYGRTIAQCFTEEVDLSCALLATETVAPRYSDLDCPGDDEY